MKIKDMLIDYFGKRLKDILVKVNEDIFEEMNEIRIRALKPLVFRGVYGEKFIDENGISTDEKRGIMISFNDIKQIIEQMSDYSPYAFNEEIKQGFITLRGGFRVGIVGRLVYENNNAITIKHISGINIRISREVKDCSNKIIDYIRQDKIKNTMLISPPNCGKTTLLRDIIRKLSNSGINIGVVDERAEIGGTYMGICQRDVGIRTDILDRCPKAIGMRMLLRSMAPEIIAVDEIGGRNDIEAIEEVCNAGVKLICTIHGSSIGDYLEKAEMKKIRENNIFECYIILSNRNGAGTIEKIYDENLNEVRI